MAFERFLIAPFNTGLQTNLRPWLIMEDAFEVLNNAYVFRGRVKKRFGSYLMGYGYPSLATAPLFSRLRILLGTTNGAGNLAGNVPGIVYKIGQMFSVGTEMFTVYQQGAPAALKSTGAGTGTFNTTTGAFSIVGSSANTDVYFYPAEPVLGLAQYENGQINNYPSYAFDTQFAYVFAGGFWSRSGTAFWNKVGGSTSNYYWLANYRGATQNINAMFVSNFQVTNRNGAGVATDDPIWYTTNGATWTAASGANGFYFAPAGGAVATGPFVQTARIIIGFKNRLVLLNTIENNNGGGLGTNSWYPQRARFSAIGSPLSASAWYEPNQFDSGGNLAAGAGFVDATTQEIIVSAELIKDRLIVYFTNSTWELVYTGNEANPFVWQKINTELGSQGTFSTVPFDKVALTIGNTGVHACNGTNVERIDEKIPDTIFETQFNEESVIRICGIRDYYTEMVYWTIPFVTEYPTVTTNLYPNKVLVYNYRNNSWATNDDSITFFGYFDQQPAVTWSNNTQTWQEDESTWQSGAGSQQFRQVIAGNQQGFVFIIDPETNRNAPALQITNMVTVGNLVNVTIIDHNLTTSDYICIENALGVTGVNDTIFRVVALVDEDTISIVAENFAGTYLGQGVVTQVSNISIYSKQWNPYVNKGMNFYLARIDFGVQKTSNGEVTVDYLPSGSDYSMLSNAQATGALMGTGVLETRPYPAALYPFEQEQDRLWHPIYFQTDGTSIQIVIYLSDTQIRNRNIAWSDFDLEGMVLHVQPTSWRLQ